MRIATGPASMRSDEGQPVSEAMERRPEATVVVTGASGFIGRAVCAELLARGAVVLAVSRSLQPAVEGLSLHRLEDYADTPLMRGSVCLHLAGTSRAQDVESNFAAELDATLRIAQRLAAGFARAVYASSAQVYGDGVREPRREDEAVAPAGPYARLKRAAEEVFLAQGHVVARIANTYGPGMSPANVLSDLLRQVPGEGEVRLRDLRPVRDYIHLRDVARGLADLACGAAPGVYNLGTGIGTSVGELAGLLLRQAGEERRPVVAAEPGGRSSSLVLDPSAAAAACGWRPSVRLAEGLTDLLRHRTSVLAG